MDKILGQTHAIRLLQSALCGGRLHHAYVFHGPSGVGKFTTARAFAAILLCHAPERDLEGHVRACGQCQSCVLVKGGAHPDDHVVTKELARHSDNPTIRRRKLITIPIDVLRHYLIEPVHLAPHLSHRKVFTVDEVELMRPEVQNVLLKTLEEPPPGTFVILVTASEDRLLPTVRSRCQRVSFVPLSRQVILECLRRRDEQLDEAHRQWLVGFSGGSLGRLELALSFDLHTWAAVVLRALDSMAARQYPTQLGQQFAVLIEDFAKRWVEDQKGVSKEAAKKQGASLLFSMIAQHARAKLTEIARTCDSGDPTSAEAALNPWLSVVDALGQAERELNSNVNLGLVADHLVSLLYRALADRQNLCVDAAI